MSIGVFLCECGGNIADVIDLGEVKRIFESEGLSVMTDEHLCSDQGYRLIEECIREEGLDRVVIGACSPMIHGRRFQDLLASAVNPNLLQIANIREQCAWVHGSDEALYKAVSLISGKVERVKRSLPRTHQGIEPYREVAVIGGGISGMTASLSLARHGVKVHLLEEKSTIGGHMVQIGKVFSPEKIAVECALCSLAPIMSEIYNHRSIELYDLSRLKRVRGSKGRFELEIERSPRYVTDECIACGRCTASCPVNVPDECNIGMKLRRAIYIPFPQAIPPTARVDIESCTRCEKCLDVCEIGAIDLNMEKKIIELRVGAIIVATGFRRFETKRVKEYGHGRFLDVLDQMELARILAVNGPTEGRLLRPSDRNPPRRLVMIQCVGSRDEKFGRRYCSKICCMIALKHACFIREHFPETEVLISYTDMRTAGFFEEYYRNAQDLGVRFIRGRASEIVEEDGVLLVRMEDTLSFEQIEIESDMVVLSGGIEASEGTTEVAEILGLGQREGGFIKGEHPKLRPVETEREGIYICGCAKDPKDITDSVIEANAAAARAFEFLRGEIKPETNDLTCEELIGEIDGIMRWKRETEDLVLVFLDEQVGYRCADNIGAKRLEYPAGIRIIMVPTIQRVREEHLRHALKRGAKLVLLGLHNETEVEIPEDLRERVLTYPVYTPYFKRLRDVFKRIG